MKKKRKLKQRGNKFLSPKWELFLLGVLGQQNKLRQICVPVSSLLDQRQPVS